MIRVNVPVPCWNFVSGGDKFVDIATRTNILLANLYGENGVIGHHFYNYQSEWPTLDKTVENSRDIAFS